jgi:two-component system response regulator RegX3
MTVIDEASLRAPAPWPSADVMPRRVLIADGERATREALADVLGHEGLEIERADDGETLLRAIRTRPYDLLIVDIVVPGLGLEACRRIRFESDVPLLILSARDSEADRVLGLEAGADDYVGKPFSVAELLSRVRAILRRRQLDLAPVRTLLRVGDLEIDLDRHQVILDGAAVSLTPTEFRLLVLLANAPGHPFSSAAILRHLWQTDYVGDAGACKAHIFNLRRKLERNCSRPGRILTVPGVGYALQP